MANVFDKYQSGYKPTGSAGTSNANTGDGVNVFAKYQKAPTQDISPPQVTQTQPKTFGQKLQGIGQSLKVGFKGLLGITQSGIGVAIQGVGGKDLRSLDPGYQAKVYKETADKIRKDLESGAEAIAPGESGFNNKANLKGIFNKDIPVYEVKKKELTPQRRKDQEQALAIMEKKALELQKEADDRVTPQEKLKLAGSKTQAQVKKDREQIDKDFGEATPWSKEWLAREVAFSVPQLLGSFGIGVATAVVTKNPIAGISVGLGSSFVQESGSAYDTAITQGVNEYQAQDVATTVGVANAMIEQLPLGEFLAKLSKPKVVKKAILSRVTTAIIGQAKQGTLEGGTETVQELVSNAIERTYNEEKGLFEGLKESGAIGFLLGLIIPGGTKIGISTKSEEKVPPALKSTTEDTKVAETTPAVGEKAQANVFEKYNAPKEVAPDTETTAVDKRKILKVKGLPAEVTGKSVVIRPDGTASYNLEVSEEARGKGVGAGAVKTIEDAILKEGATKIELPVKEESVGFFEKQGYKAVGEAKSGLVTMTKTLGEGNTAVTKAKVDPLSKIEKLTDVTGKEQSILRITKSAGEKLFLEKGFEQQPNKNFWKKGDTYAHFNTVDKTWHIEGKISETKVSTPAKKAVKIKPAPAQPSSKTPVGTGTEKQSGFQKRLQSQLLATDPARYALNEQDGSYNQLNLKEDGERSVDYLENNPEDAVAVSLGLKPAPAGHTDTGISIATALKAKQESNFSLFSQIINSLTQRLTRLGQEIVSVRGHFTDDSAENYIKRAIDTRMKSLASRLVSKAESRGKSFNYKETVTEKVDTEVAKAKKALKEEQSKISLAQDIINKLRC